MRQAAAPHPSLLRLPW